MPKPPKHGRNPPSDDDKSGGKRASRKGGKPGKTKNTMVVRNLETGKSYLTEQTKLPGGGFRLKIIGRNNPN